MKHLFEYINIRKAESTLIATDDTIKKIVKDVLDKLGYEVDMNYIDVSAVTNMNSLFSSLGRIRRENLNPDISKWDVSNVKDMRFMFEECTNFNSDISEWDVSNVKTMNSMFSGCENFNQDLSKWDVSNVENMSFMFTSCDKFNQDLSKWDVSNVKDMANMFVGCHSFNQDLSKWDVSNISNSDHFVDYLFAGSCPIRDEFKPKFRK